MKSKVSYLGLLIAIALIFSYIESLIPFYFGIPGIKLGLANVAILLTLYLYGFKEAFFVNITRILLISLLFGNIYSFWFSLSGGLLSLFSMVLLLNFKKFSVIGISIAGGTIHNIGQILFAVVFFQMEAFLYYIPILLITGAVTGALIGIILYELNKRMHFIRGEKE